MIPSLRAGAATFAMLALAACADGSPTAARVRQPASPAGTVTAALECRVTVATGDLRCGERRPGGARGDLILGSAYAQVSSRNHAYDPATGRYTFEVALTNRFPQKIGTVDGTAVAPSGIRAFFHQGPTVTAGSGSVSVIPDGFASFTGVSQPYYAYNEILVTNQQSAWRTWVLVMPPTVTSFDFTLYVSAPVQHSTGWVEITPQSIDTYAGYMELLSATVYNVFGVAQSDSVIWSSDDPSVALISVPGLMYAAGAGTTTLRATSAGSPFYTGAISVTVH